MPRGRPPKPGTVEEKAAARRERVRQNVRALRESTSLEWVNSDGCKDVTQDGDEGSTPETMLMHRTSTLSQRIGSASAASGSLFVINQKNNAVFKFPTSVDTKGPYATALLGTVRQQFLPDSVYLPPTISKTADKPWESDHFLWTPCAFWITSAYAKASNQDNSLLKTALLAMGMLLKSFEHHDASLRIASLEMYRRCISGIRKVLEPSSALNAKRPKDTFSLYMSCHAAAMFELVMNSDMRATMHHLRGISSLICYLGEDVDDEGQSIAWMLLQDYRFAEMGLCLKFRYASPSSIRRRQFENSKSQKLPHSKRPSPGSGSGNHMLVTITDVADEIAGVMVQLDQLRPRLMSSNTPGKLMELIKDLNKVYSRYDTLYGHLTARYGTAFVSIDSDGDDNGLGYFKFQTFDMGAAWCYNLMTQIYCVETIIETATLLLRVRRWTSSIPSPPDSKVSDDIEDCDAESFDEPYLRNKVRTARDQHRGLCVQISQCLQYFLQTGKGITGQSLAIFPLDAAACMIDVEMARLDADLHQAEAMQAPSSRLTSVSRQRAELQMAKVMCHQMQLRAQSFGLPILYTAGPTETGVNFEAEGEGSVIG